MSLRYAILHHTGISDPHFDLMFEAFPGSELTTWRSPIWPPMGLVNCVRLKNHRRIYLDYEGEIGQGRGRVDRIASGQYEVEVGVGDVWMVKILDGSPAQNYRFSQVNEDQWIVEASAVNFT